MLIRSPKGTPMLAFWKNGMAWGWGGDWICLYTPWCAPMWGELYGDDRKIFSLFGFRLVAK